MGLARPFLVCNPECLYRIGLATFPLLLNQGVSGSAGNQFVCNLPSQVFMNGLSLTHTHLWNLVNRVPTVFVQLNRPACHFGRYSLGRATPQRIISHHLSFPRTGSARLSRIIRRPSHGWQYRIPFVNIYSRPRSSGMRIMDRSCSRVSAFCFFCKWALGWRGTYFLNLW